MGGVLMLLEGGGGTSGGGGGGGGGTTLDPLHWTNITGSFAGATNTQTISGITNPVSLSVVITGGATLRYDLNGTYANYTGAFNVVATDTLSWLVVSVGSAHAGTITVTNATTSTVVATISYSVSG
jgi:hypothetical protein